MTVPMPELAAPRRIGTTILATAAAGVAAIALAAPAHAAYDQNCIDTLGGRARLCVSYNYDNDTPAANVQWDGATTTVDLALQNPNGTNIVTGRKAIGGGQWFGIYKSGLPYRKYCAYSAMAGGRVCL
jgi:hypothetical protein